MKKKMVSILTAAFCVSALLAGCGFADTAKNICLISRSSILFRRRNDNLYRGLRCRIPAVRLHGR